MSALRVYVAGSSQDVEIIRGLMNDLRRRGIVITHDWTPAVLDAKQLGLPFESIEPVTRRAHAFADLRGVRSADVLWLVLGSSTLGAWSELGGALILGKPVVVSGSTAALATTNIFLSLVDRTYVDHGDAIDYLRELHRACSGGGL